MNHCQQAMLHEWITQCVPKTDGKKIAFKSLFKTNYMWQNIKDR